MSNPHVCPLCKGKKSPNCHPCKGSGIVWEPDTTQQLVDAIGKILPMAPDPDIHRYPNPGDVPPVVPGIIPADPLNPFLVGPVITWSCNPTDLDAGRMVEVILHTLARHPVPAFPGC